MPLRGSLIRSIARHRWIAGAAAALWIAAAASFIYPATRAQLALTSRLTWLAVAALLAALSVAAAALAGAIPPAIRRRLPAVLVLLSAPTFVLLAGTGGMRSPALPVAGLLLMSVTATLGYRGGAAG